MVCNYSLALRKGVNILECPTEPPATTFGRKTLLMPLIGIAAFLIYIYIFQVDILAIFSILLRKVFPIPKSLSSNSTS